MNKRTIPFKGFNDRDDVRIYNHGILPHWRQNGCTYFVTFRLADSLPASVVSKLDEERQCWLKGNNIDPNRSDWKTLFAKLPPDKQREYERTIGENLNRQLDRGLGGCALRAEEPMKLMAGALEHFHGERTWTGDYVVMPNHVHVLMTPINGHELEDILKSIKGYSAKVINSALSSSGTFWQRESYDHIARDADQLEKFQTYIRNNPAKAVLKEGDYFLSEATYENSSP